MSHYRCVHILHHTSHCPRITDSFTFHPDSQITIPMPDQSIYTLLKQLQLITSKNIHPHLTHHTNDTMKVIEHLQNQHKSTTSPPRNNNIEQPRVNTPQYTITQPRMNTQTPTTTNTHPRVQPITNNSTQRITRSNTRHTNTPKQLRYDDIYQATIQPTSN